MNKEAIRLINLMISEEESDIECKLIEKGTLKESNIYYREIDDDFTWKLKHIKVLKYIKKCLEDKNN
jgi:hypothetical protein